MAMTKEERICKSEDVRNEVILNVTNVNLDGEDWKVILKKMEDNVCVSWRRKEYNEIVITNSNFRMMSLWSNLLNGKTLETNFDMAELEKIASQCATDWKNIPSDKVESQTSGSTKVEIKGNVLSSTEVKLNDETWEAVVLENTEKPAAIAFVDKENKKLYVRMMNKAQVAETLANQIFSVMLSEALKNAEKNDWNIQEFCSAKMQEIVDITNTCLAKLKS